LHHDNIVTSQVRASGQCHDRKAATGAATYDTFVMHPSVVDELDEQLRLFRLFNFNIVSIIALNSCD